MKSSFRIDVEPFRAMEFVASANRLACEGRDIISMAVGQPSAQAPTMARAAAADAIQNSVLGYTDANGRRSLRLRLAKYYHDHYRVEIDPARIVVTTGSSAGFMLTFLAAFDPGERIAIPSPGYPAYRNILRALSLEPVILETSEETRWAVNADMIFEAYKRQPFAGLLVANPNNPNGTMNTPEAFAGIVERCTDLDIRLISDEIYHGLTYGVAEVTAAALSPDAFVINSFSKYFCMTGWRIGWMIVPEALVGRVERLQQNAFICAPDVSQIGAEAALDGTAEMDVVKQGYEANRTLFLRRLPELGFSTVQPVDGAFYAYADLTPFMIGSAKFAASLLHDAGVAVTPGIDFDPAHGDHWLRFSFAGAHQRMAQGLDRIEAWLAKTNAA